jgi:tetratricopeptide (TPR) repeat protein
VQAVDQILPKESDLRYELGHALEATHEWRSAITQFGLWIDAHSVDEKLPIALNERCWDRAVLNVDLSEALEDCNRSIRMLRRANSYDSRALVWFHKGRYDQSITDYNEALKLNPKMAPSLYGRGVAELRKGMADAGQADIKAAVALRPNVAAAASEAGLTP